MTLQLANAKVDSINLPNHIFDFFWCEKNISTTTSPTLLRLLTIDFSHGVETMPYIGPLKTDRAYLCQAMMLACAEMINSTKGLAEIIRLAGCGPAIDKLERGKPKDLGHSVNYLNERRDVLRMQRNALEDNPEPDLFNYIQLEDVLRQLNVASALQGLAEFFRHAPGSSYTPDWRRVADLTLMLWESAACKRRIGSSRVFPATKQQRHAFSKAFATAFLKAYEEPPIKWRM